MCHQLFMIIRQNLSVFQARIQSAETSALQGVEICCQNERNYKQRERVTTTKIEDIKQTVAKCKLHQKRVLLVVTSHDIPYTFSTHLHLLRLFPRITALHLSVPLFVIGSSLVLISPFEACLLDSQSGTLLKLTAADDEDIEASFLTHPTPFFRPLI